MSDSSTSGFLCSAASLCRRWITVGVVSFALVSLIVPSSVYAKGGEGEGIEQSSESRASVAEVDQALFLELVKLAKFNIHFHMEANRRQKWRRYTYPLGREVGTGLSFSATLIDITQQVRGLDHPRRISRGALKKGVACSITGNAISGSSSALELAQNAWVMLKARENGYSPARSLSFVRGVVATTDELLDTRKRLAAEEPSQERRRVFELETALFKRIRQQLLYEFGTWSCHSRDQAWRENTFYTIDSLQSFTRMTAGIMGMKAFKNPKISQTAVDCVMVASCLQTLNPIIRNLVGLTVRKHQERVLAKVIPMSRPEASTPDLDQLHERLTAEGATESKPPLNKVVALYGRSERLDSTLDREQKEIDRFREVAQQQSISGPLIGLTGVASATLSTTAIYGYRADPHTAIRLGLAGRISHGTGQAYALINTPYTFIRGMRRSKRLSERGELPSQVLEARLKRLEAYQKDPVGKY